MAKWKVEINRTESKWETYDVEAPNREVAEEKALALAYKSKAEDWEDQAGNIYYDVDNVKEL